MIAKNSLTLLAAISAALAVPTALAQDAGRPELTGTWSNKSLTGLTRPDGVDKLVVSAEEAAEIIAGTSVAGLPLGEVDGAIDPETGAPPEGSFDFGLRGYNEFWIDPGNTLAQVGGEYRSSYIVIPENGQVPRLENPSLDFEPKRFGSRYVTGVGDASGPEAIPLAERCLLGFGNTAGPGMMGTLYNSTYEFVQTDDYVMIAVEMVHDARIIPTFDSAEEARANRRPAVLQQWLGDSVGWYEDDTLVVETVNINPQQLAESSIPITGEGRIIERFSRTAEDEILYQFTVEDPNIYSQAWTAELSYYPQEEPMYEYACHEGNYALPGILAGARRQEVVEELGQGSD
mgnify:CR=1 FL=1|jgi:hypothetical protein